MPINFFKKAIIVFWAAWSFTALWTDVAGGLTHMGVWSFTWAPDNNYPFLIQSLKMYSVADWIPQVLFSLIVFGEFLCFILFLWASLALSQAESVWMKRADQAFVFTLIFWMAFFVADQCVMNYDLEENHMVQGGFELLTYLALYCLPSRPFNPEKSK